MNDDERALQDWQDYVDAYDTDSVAARQHVDSVLNDPNASAADKEAARHDMIVQDLFGQWLRTTNDSIQESGVIPDSLHFDGGYIYGGLWSDGTNIKTGFMYTYSGNVVSGSKTYKLPVCCLDGEVLSIEAESTTTNLRFQRYRWNVQTTSGNVTFVIGNINDSGNVHWKFGGVDVTYAGSAYNGWCCYYHWGGGTPPIHTDFNNLARVSANTSQNWNAEQIIGDVSLISQTGFDVDPNAPWDAYNDNILPNITPENAVFPNGYQPFDPDQPQDEPKNLPDIAGEDEDMQDDSTLVSPAMFITQYILSAAQLRSLGENLWTSWLTPNTDVWKNFWYNFSAQADTGTCDIGAVLNFITSLKVFPFNLASMTTDYLSATDGIYIGTGHTNFLPGDIAILNTVIGYLDAGTVDVNLQYPYSDFRDYYNCSVMIFLPFCGTVQVNPVEVIGRTLHAKYYIDFQSGACTAIVLTSNGEHEYILCSKSGQIGFSIPITATNAGQLAARFAGDAVQTAGTLSGLFFNVAGNIANSAEQMAKALTFNKTASEGNEKQVPTGMTATSALNVGKAGVDASLNLAEQAIDRLSRSAVDMPMLSGGSGCESLFQPSHAFVQIRRGKYAKPDNYPHSVAHLNLSSNPISYYKGKYNGTPSTGSDTDKGFCVFTNVDTSGLDCREDERAEIVALLESGIYL